MATARLLQPFPHTNYEKILIPDLDFAVKRLNKQIGLEQVQSCLNKLGSIFVKHNTYQKYGLIMIHRHFDLGLNEILVDTMKQDGSLSLAVPWVVQEGKHASPADTDYWNSFALPLQKFIAPETWAFGSTGQLVPFEFHTVDEEQEIPTQDFVSELYNELKCFGIENIFGLRIHNPKSWESTPPNVRANILHFGEAPKDISAGELLPVFWTFDEHGQSAMNGHCIIIQEYAPWSGEPCYEHGR